MKKTLILWEIRRAYDIQILAFVKHHPEGPPRGSTLTEKNECCFFCQK